MLSYFTSHSDVEKYGKVRSIFRLLNDPLTKVWLNFLLNTLNVFDKFNVNFQTTSTATVHRLHGEMERLLKSVLSFFVKPTDIRRHSKDLTKLPYMDESLHLPNEDLFVGDSTTALLIDLTDNEGGPVNNFYSEVVSFFMSFVKKQLKCFDFSSDIFHTLSFLDPLLCQDLPLSTFDSIGTIFSIAFDKDLVKLEHREFMIEDLTDIRTECDAVKFWVTVLNLKSPMGGSKYKNLATLALQLLSIPASNADSERVFSLVRRIKTDYRSSLSTETVSALIGCHFNNTATCCETYKFDHTLLSKVKTCTRQRNPLYIK